MLYLGDPRTRWTPPATPDGRGDVQGEPRIFVLPAEESFQFGFAWTVRAQLRSHRARCRG
jgi:hypothetical protein